MLHNSPIDRITGSLPIVNGYADTTVASRMEGNQLAKLEYTNGEGDQWTFLLSRTLSGSRTAGNFKGDQPLYVLLFLAVRSVDKGDLVFAVNNGYNLRII